jgi:glycosyltransferase involved in cell wall biosynthesis
VSFKPTVSLITGGTQGGSHPRISRWLGRGFERLGEPFDSVHVERPRSIEYQGSTRVVRLGTARLRWAGPTIGFYLRSARPKLALATPIEVAVVALTVARLTGANVTPWEQTMARVHVGDHARRFGTLPFFERLTYGNARMIAATSEDVATDLLEHLDGRITSAKVEVLPNPIDGDEIRCLAAPPADRRPGFRLCAIGRLTRQKGHDLLLEAAAQAAPQLGRDWELLICGEGPLLDQLERQAHRLGVSDHVRFLGFVENPYPLLASSDVFVHSARWEGFGLVLAEALALGVPVVAASCPGAPREILADGMCGILVPPEDPRGLAEALARVAEDTGLRRDLSERGQERVLQYAPEIIARRALDLAERVT